MLIDTTAAYETAKIDINQHSTIVWDTETNGLMWENRVVGIGILAGENPYYFPFRHGEGVNLPEGLLQDIANNILVPTKLHIGHNLGFDLRMMHKEGMRMPRKMRDSQISCHVMNNLDCGRHSKMETLAAKYIDPDAGTAEEALTDMLVARFKGGRLKAKKNLWRLAGHEVAEYGCQDVVTTRNLYEFCMKSMGRWRLESVLAEVCAQQLVLTDVEIRGILLDVEGIHKCINEAGPRIEELEKKLHKYAGYKCNPRSSQQMMALFKAKSTDKDALTSMIATDDPRAEMADTLLEHRMHSKVVSTYYKPFLENMDSNHRLHPNLNIVGTETGRLTCSKPNLLAVPGIVKNIMIADPGHEYAEFDLSQAEIRVAAHYSQDDELLRIIHEGLNIHDIVAERQKIERKVAKQLNLSTQYGMGAKRFGEKYGHPLYDAEVFIKNNRKMFAGRHRFYNLVMARAKRTGYIRLHSGDVRRFDPSVGRYYPAMSVLGQSTVNAMIRKALIQVSQEVPEFKLYIPVHDSLTGLIPKDPEIQREVVAKVTAIMEDQPWCTVPILSDVKVGPTWGAAKEPEYVQA